MSTIRLICPEIKWVFEPITSVSDYRFPTVTDYNDLARFLKERNMQCSWCQMAPERQTMDKFLYDRPDLNSVNPNVEFTAKFLEEFKIREKICDTVYDRAATLLHGLMSQERC